MGNSGAYGGSGGREWGKARERAREYGSDSSGEAAQQLLSNIAEALDWDRDGDGTPPEVLTPVVARPRLRVPSGRGDGPGSSGGGAATRQGGGRGGGGRGRSRSHAAAVGGSVAAAGLALRERDRATLERFGLSLAELERLEPYEQARRILDAVSGTVGGTQEDELQHASGVAILALLVDGATPDDAVRAFITDFVFEVSITEIGDELRDGNRDGHTTVDQEDQLRDLIETSVNQVDLPTRLTMDNIQAAIYRALGDARTFLRASE